MKHNTQNYQPFFSSFNPDFAGFSLLLQFYAWFTHIAAQYSITSQLNLSHISCTDRWRIRIWVAKFLDLIMNRAVRFGWRYSLLFPTDLRDVVNANFRANCTYCLVARWNKCSNPNPTLLEQPAQIEIIIEPNKNFIKFKTQLFRLEN